MKEGFLLYYRPRLVDFRWKKVPSPPKLNFIRSIHLYKAYNSYLPTYLLLQKTKLDFHVGATKIDFIGKELSSICTVQFRTSTGTFIEQYKVMAYATHKQNLDSKGNAPQLQIGPQSGKFVKSLPDQVSSSCSSKKHPYSLWSPITKVW